MINVVHDDLSTTGDIIHFFFISTLKDRYRFGVDLQYLDPRKNQQEIR